MLKCFGVGCPLRDDCYRYTQPYVKRDFFAQAPFDPATQSCEYFHSNLPDPDYVRDSAYQIWLREGKPFGRDRAHWQQAWDEACRSTGRAQALWDLHRYSSDNPVPANLEAQVKQLLDAEWEGPASETGPLTDPALHPEYFVLSEPDSQGIDRVLSYGRAIRADVEIDGKRYRIWGIGDIVTDPARRDQGWGSRIASAATDVIRSDLEAALGLLITSPSDDRFYAAHGWQHEPDLRLITDEDPNGCDRYVMLLWLPQGDSLREYLHSHPLVLPGKEW